MKKNIVAMAMAALVLFVFTSCGSSPSQPVSPGQQITPASEKSQPAPLVPAQPANGKGMRLGILSPHGQGLNENQAYVPAMIQGVLVSDIAKYSAITVLDRISLDRVIMETLDASYEDDLDIVQLGHVAQAGYILTGSITQTSTGFSLHLNVTDTTPNAAIVASYSGACTSAELDDHSAIHRASLELLAQMNVQLTAKSRNELGRASTAADIGAQTALAWGVTAQRQGTEVAAFSYFLQAANLDPGLTEAAARLKTVSAGITGGMGRGVQNDMQWRTEWMGRLRETEQFMIQSLRQSPAFYLVYPSSSDQWGIEYEGNTVTFNLEFHVLPDPAWFESTNRLVRTIRGGLLATGRAEDWRLNWPGQVISRPSPFGDMNNTYPVVVEISNAKGSLGRQTANLRFGWFIHNEREVDGLIMPYITYASKLSFPRINASDVSGDLSMKIITVNGRPADSASQLGIRALPRIEYNAIPGIISHGLHLDNFSQYTISFAENRNRLTAYRGRATTIDIPWGATIIDDRLLNEKGLMGITIPSSVLIIGREAFSKNRLTSVTIPDSVTSIDYSAFANNQLTSVIIGAGITNIGENAFRNNHLTSITIGANVNFDMWTFIDDYNRRFSGAYIDAGRRAGTYTWSNGNSNSWTRR